MFERGELEFLLMCVDSKASQDTRTAKMKAHCLFKLSDLIDQSAQSEQVKNTEDQADEPDVKKTPKK